MPELGTQKKTNNKNNFVTLRQKIAFKHFLEKHGTVADAMRAAGYSDSSIKNPSNLTQSKGFIRILEQAGLTDELLSKTHLELLGAAVIQHLSFPATKREVKTLTGKNGRKLHRPKTEWKSIHIPDEEIKRQIESVPGHKLMYILKGTTEKTAYYQAPEAGVRTKQIEMGYKIKGHFAPEKVEHTLPPLTPEEEAQLDKITKKNLK